MPGMVCGDCLHNPPVYGRARAPLRYNDASSGMILKFKHADGTHLSDVFSGFLMQAASDFLPETDLIIPVPLHRWRLIKRRYNQAALLGDGLSKKTGILHAPHILRRNRHTVPQGSKNKAERAENVEKAFTILPKDIARITGKNILLIDDVLTSGATINECAKVLLGNGAETVNVLTLARVVRSL